jgi:hypothetical protein
MAEPEKADWTINRSDGVNVEPGSGLSREWLCNKLCLRSIDPETGQEIVVEAENHTEGEQLRDCVRPEGGTPPIRTRAEAQALANEAVEVLSTAVILYAFTLRLDQLLAHASGESRPAAEIAEGDNVALEHAPQPLYVATTTKNADAGTVYVVAGDKNHRRRLAIEMRLGATG